MEISKGVFLFILVVIMFATPICGKAITCTAGDFAAGKVGFIVCSFPDDNHPCVFVQCYPFSAPTNASAKTTGVTPAEEGDRDSDELDERQDSSAKTVHPDETGTQSVCTLVRVIVAVIVVAAVVFIVILVIIIRWRRQMSPERFNCMLGMVILMVVFNFTLLVVIMLATPTRGKAITCTAGYFAADETGTAVRARVAVIVVYYVFCIIVVVIVSRRGPQRYRERLLGMKFLEGVFPFILVVIMLATPTCGKAITCSAGDFTAGEVGLIVCYFPDYIDAHHSVFVQYYPFSAPTDASATGVFLCKTEDMEASKCKEQDGYALKSHTRNILLIEIINITEKAAGRYNCQFLPPDHSPRDMCSLTVRAKTAGVTPTGEGDRDSDVLDKGKNSPTTTVHPDETGTVSVGTFVGVVVAVIVVAAVVCIIIVVIVFRVRRQRPLERTLSDPLINHGSDNNAPATGSAHKRSIHTQVSVDRAQTVTV